MYHQSLAEALSPNVWGRWEATMRWWLSHPGMRAWWVTKPAPLTADFEAFLNRMFDNDPMDPVALERWRQFVAGEGLPSRVAQARLTDLAVSRLTRPPATRYCSSK